MNQYDHIRKNLKEYNVPVNKDKLWANTAHAIPQKRKKRGAFFLLLGGALLISSAVTFYALSNSDKTIATYTENQSTSNINANAPISATINTANQETTESTMTTTSTLESTQEQFSNTKSIPEKSKPQASVAKTTTPSSQSNTIKSNISIQNTEVADAGNNAGTMKEPSFPVETNGTQPIVALTIPNIETEADHLTAATNTLEPILQESISETRNEHYLTEKISTLQISELDILDREISTSEAVATQSKNKNRISLLLMQGYGWTTMGMDATDPELNATVDVWEGKIKSLENLSTSLHTVLRLPKGIQFSSGLQYSKLSTQLEYLWTTGEDFTEEGITAVIIDENGNTQNLIGDVEVHRETQVLSTRYSSQTRLDLEMMLHVALIKSYRMETGVWIKGGYNLLYTSSGTTFSPNDPLLKYTNDENPYSLPSPFTFGAGIGTLYRLSPHWTLNARLGYERLRYTHGLFDNNIRFDHDILSLSIGTGYTF